MYPRSQYYGSSNRYFFGATDEVCNYDHLTVVTSKGFREDCLSNFILCIIRAQPLKELAII